LDVFEASACQAKKKGLYLLLGLNIPAAFLVTKRRGTKAFAHARRDNFEAGNHINFFPLRALSERCAHFFRVSVFFNEFFLARTV